jgi:hypothetical protein
VPEDAMLGEWHSQVKSYVTNIQVVAFKHIEKNK